MSQLTSDLTPKEREERRLEAALLLQTTELSKAEIARLVGVSRAAVTQWAQQMKKRRQGIDSLSRRPHTGRPPRLTRANWRRVLSRIRRGAKAAGFPTKRWTLKRIQQLIEQEFGFSYSTSYLAEKIKQIGWNWRELPPKKVRHKVTGIFHQTSNHWAQRARYRRNG
jgi:transposase